MTLAEINRMIRAAIRAARQEGASLVEVKIGDAVTVRIPLAPDKPIAKSDGLSCERLSTASTITVEPDQEIVL